MQYDKDFAKVKYDEKTCDKLFCFFTISNVENMIKKSTYAGKSRVQEK